MNFDSRLTPAGIHRCHENKHVEALDMQVRDSSKHVNAFRRHLFDMPSCRADLFEDRCQS